jgi:uncharacterized protein YqeY
MSLKEKIKADLTEARKAKDALRVSTIRLLVSTIKNREIDARKELDDEGVLAVLLSAVKQRKESIEQFEGAGRTDLSDKEKAELAILQTYMPEQMGRDEVLALVKEAVSETGAEGPKDMGKVMKALMPKVKGKADGRLVNDLVKEALGG